MRPAIPVDAAELPEHTWTVAQAAAYLNCSSKAVLRLVARGQLPVGRLGSRTVRLRPDDVRGLIRWSDQADGAGS
jgi:excisionase family DNA binding protein